MQPFIHHLLRHEMRLYFENDTRLDDLFQSLVVMRFYIHTDKKNDAFELLQSLLRKIQQGQAQNYRPALSWYPLEMALEGLCLGYKPRHAPISFSKEGEGGSLTREQSYVFYRLTEEVLKNALQHADASRISVKLALQPTQIKLWISDNGKGFSLPGVRKAKSEAFGLRLIRELVNVIGASVKFKTAPGEGTKLYVTLKGNFQNP